MSEAKKKAKVLCVRDAQGRFAKKPVSPSAFLISILVELGCFNVQAKIWREHGQGTIFYFLEKADLDLHFISMLACSCKSYKEILRFGNAMYLTRYSRSMEANSERITGCVVGMCAQMARVIMCFIQDNFVFDLLYEHDYGFRLCYGSAFLLYGFALRLPTFTEKNNIPFVGLMVDYTIGNSKSKLSIPIQYTQLSTEMWTQAIRKALVDLTAGWRDVLQAQQSYVF